MENNILSVIAAEQVTASLASWFGVDDELMPTLFPNLKHFQPHNNIASSYLNLFQS